MWSIRDWDSYSDELKHIIKLITGGKLSKGEKPDEKQTLKP